MKIVEHRIDGLIHYFDLDCPEIETRKILYGYAPGQEHVSSVILKGPADNPKEIRSIPTFRDIRDQWSERTYLSLASQHNGLWVIRAKFRDGSVGFTTVLGTAALDPKNFEIIVIGPCTAKVKAT